MLGQFDEALPPGLQWEVTRQGIVQETGWTFEYVDNLSLHDVAMFWALRGGQNKVSEHRAWLREVRKKPKGQR